MNVLTPELIFMIVATLSSGFLGFIWNRKGWANTWIKFAMIGLAGWGAFLIFTSLGFIVQVG